MHVEPVLSIEELQSLIRKTKVARLANRYRAVLLAVRGRTAKEIAHDLCACTRSVQEWVCRYNSDAVEAWKNCWASDIKSRDNKSQSLVIGGLSEVDVDTLVQRIQDLSEKI